jgi:hypothetical protein
MWMATLTGFESGAGQQGIRRGCTVFGVEAELGGCLLSVYSEGGEHVFREEHHGDGDGSGGGGGGWGDGKAGRRSLDASRSALKGVRSNTRLCNFNLGSTDFSRGTLPLSILEHPLAITTLPNSFTLHALNPIPISPNLHPPLCPLFLLRCRANDERPPLLGREETCLSAMRPPSPPPPPLDPPPRNAAHHRPRNPRSAKHKTKALLLYPNSKSPVD